MSELTVFSLFEAAATRSPDRDAVIDDETTATHGELLRLVKRIGDDLRRRHGVVATSRVVILSANRVEFLAAVLACAQMGAVAVPVSTQLTARELDYIIGNCTPRVILYGSEYRDVVRSAGGGTEQPIACAIDAVGSRDDAEPSPPPSRPRSQDLLYLGYTSGTTGLPKGIAVTHGNRVTSILLQSTEFGLGRDDVHLVVSPLYHTAPLTFALLHLCLGGAVRLTGSFDAENVARKFSDGSVTNSFLAPAALRRVLQHLKPPSERLHAVIVGGAPCPVDVKDSAIAMLPGRLFEFYGATEVGVVSILRPEDQQKFPRSAGRLIPGVAVQIRDPQSGSTLPLAEIGEVWISTTTQSEQANGAVPGPPADWKFLGDVGYLDAQGYLYLVDRSADIVISGGMNVYSREVEAVIEAHPLVRDVAVFGVPDDVWGETVVAAVVASDQGLDPEALAAHCAQSLARYKQPRRFEFLAQLPRSQTGKVDKKALRALFVAAKKHTTTDPRS